MRININASLQNGRELLKASVFPLSVLLVSLGIFLLNKRYIESASSLGIVLEQTSLASFAGSIFYFLTNTVSSYVSAN
jgi:hypothetical protein